MPPTFNRVFLILLVASLGSGCAGIIRPVRDAISPPGQLSANGTVTPCHGYRSDYQACGNAIYNAKVISKLAIGMSIDDARAIVKRAPERREQEAQGGSKVDIWWFLTDYDRWLSTRIEFRGGQIVSIRTEPAA